MLLDALLEISDSDPLLRYYVDSTTHEIILSFLGKVQMEVIDLSIQEKPSSHTAFHFPTEAVIQINQWKGYAMVVNKDCMVGM